MKKNIANLLLYLFLLSLLVSCPDLFLDVEAVIIKNKSDYTIDVFVDKEYKNTVAPATEYQFGLYTKVMYTLLCRADLHQWGPLDIKLKKGKPYTWNIENPPEPAPVPTGDIQVINNASREVEFYISGIFKGIIPSGYNVTYTEEIGNYDLYAAYPGRYWEEVIELTKAGYIWDLEDFIEDYPAKNCHVWNFENNAEDQYGIDDWDIKSHVFYSSSFSKFGNYSLYADNNFIANLTSVSHWGTIGESQGAGVWILPYDFTESFSDIFFMLTEEWLYDYIALGIDKDPVGIRFFAKIRKDTTDSILYTNYLDTLKWHYIAISYEAKSNTFYFIYNKETLSVNPPGIWGTGSMAIQILAENTHKAQYHVDEFILIPDQFISPALFVQHYERNVQWGGEYEH